jgi:hypothetical protein
LCNICEMGCPFYYKKTLWLKNPAHFTTSVDSSPSSGTLLHLIFP